MPRVANIYAERSDNVRLAHARRMRASGLAPRIPVLALVASFPSNERALAAYERLNALVEELGGTLTAQVIPTRPE